MGFHAAATYLIMIACEDIPNSAHFMALSDLAAIDVDLRYATCNNFLMRVLYQGMDCAYLRIEAALALEQAGQWLASRCPGTRIRVLDALRPQRIQEQLYREFEDTPQAMYLAHPKRGSIHSFGMAVDVTLLDAQGHELDMGSGFDEMTLASHPDREAEHLATGVLTAAHLVNRGWLRAAMRLAGFHGIHSEWWHFDFGDRDVVRRDLPRVL
jgi:D-alanyl-D-alanine dipeptidase